MKWRIIQEDTQRNLGDVLREYSVELSPGESGVQIESRCETVKLDRRGKFDLARDTTMGGGVGLGLAGLGVDILIPSALLAGPFAPFVLLGVLGAGAAGVYGALKKTNASLSKSNKSALGNFVSNQLAKLQAQLCMEPQDDGLTRLQQFCEAQRKAVQEACKTLAERERERLEQDVKLIADAASANAEKAQEAMAALSARMALMPPVKEKLTAVYSGLVEFDKQKSA